MIVLLFLLCLLTGCSHSHPVLPNSEYIVGAQLIKDSDWNGEKILNTFCIPYVPESIVTEDTSGSWGLKTYVQFYTHNYFAGIGTFPELNTCYFQIESFTAKGVK